MVFTKGEKKAAAKGKVAPVGNVIPPPEKKHGPTVQHKAYDGAHFNHEDKQHIKFLRNKIKEHKPLSPEDLEWAKEHKIDVSHAVVKKAGAGPGSPRSPKAGKKKKIDYDNITFD